jgi:hypothetical protein
MSSSQSVAEGVSLTATSGSRVTSAAEIHKFCNGRTATTTWLAPEATATLDCFALDDNSPRTKKYSKRASKRPLEKKIGVRIPPSGSAQILWQARMAVAQLTSLGHLSLPDQD